MSRLWCRLWHDHKPREALGTVMVGLVPHFYYHCKRCGTYFTEAWK